MFNGEGSDDFFYWANVGEGENVQLEKATLLFTSEIFPSDEDL